MSWSLRLAEVADMKTYPKIRRSFPHTQLSFLANPSSFESIAFVDWLFIPATPVFILSHFWAVMVVFSCYAVLASAGEWWVFATSCWYITWLKCLIILNCWTCLHFQPLLAFCRRRSSPSIVLTMSTQQMVKCWMSAVNHMLNPQHRSPGTRMQFLLTVRLCILSMSLAFNIF